MRRDADGLVHPRHELIYAVSLLQGSEESVPALVGGVVAELEDQLVPAVSQLVVGVRLVSALRQVTGLHRTPLGQHQVTEQMHLCLGRIHAEHLIHPVVDPVALEQRVTVRVRHEPRDRLAPLRVLISQLTDCLRVWGFPKSLLNDLADLRESRLQTTLHGCFDLAVFGARLDQSQLSVIRELLVRHLGNHIDRSLVGRPVLVLQLSRGVRRLRHFLLRALVVRLKPEPAEHRRASLWRLDRQAKRELPERQVAARGVEGRASQLEQSLIPEYFEESVRTLARHHHRIPLRPPSLLFSLRVDRVALLVTLILPLQENLCQRQTGHGVLVALVVRAQIREVRVRNRRNRTLIPVLHSVAVNRIQLAQHPLNRLLRGGQPAHGLLGQVVGQNLVELDQVLQRQLGGLRRR